MICVGINCIIIVLSSGFPPGNNAAGDFKTWIKDDHTFLFMFLTGFNCLYWGLVYQTHEHDR